MKAFNIFSKIILSVILIFSGFQLFAQDSAEEAQPVTDIFNSSLLIDQQTNTGPWAHHLELIIHHRFGTMNNGFSDLAGVYASSNIRLGFNYGITERLSVGIGTERYNKMQDLYGKYLILQQKESGMPISLSFLTQVTLDARNANVFEESYQFIDRFSFFEQLIASKKFGEKLSLQVAPSFMHFNAVESDSTHWNDYFGLSAGGRYKFTDMVALVATYDQGFAFTPTIPSSQKDARIEKLEAPKPSFGLGVEISTPTHCFMVFASNSNAIIPQKNLAYNTSSVTDGFKGIRLGFDLTVRF
jgi:hypothetical protein